MYFFVTKGQINFKNDCDRGEYSMDTELFSNARTLANPILGHIIRLDELRDGFYSRRKAGDGFAVKPLLLTLPRKLTELLSIEQLNISAPTSGAVTSLSENSISFRTADGLNISLLLGDIEKIHWHTDLGNVLKKGEPICSFSRTAAENNGFGGSVLTLFTQPLQISELHVDTGFRWKGDRVAFFRLRA